MHELAEALGYAQLAGRVLVLNHSCPWSLHPGPPGAASFWPRYLQALSPCSLEEGHALEPEPEAQAGPVTQPEGREPGRQHGSPGPRDPIPGRVAHWRPGMRLGPQVRRVAGGRKTGPRA